MGCYAASGETTGRYRRFLDAVRLAGAESERRAVQKIRAAGDRDWKAESTWLRRRHRERWSEQTSNTPPTAVVVIIGTALAERLALGKVKFRKW